MVLFKDISKGSSDLLYKGFTHEKPWDVEYKYSAKNPAITNNACINQAGGFDASSTLKFSVQDLTTEMKMMSTGNSYIDLKYNLSQLKGLSFGTRFERKGLSIMKSGVLDLSTEYATNACHTKLIVSPLSSSFALSTLFAKNCMQAGGEVSGNFDASQLKYTIGASYSRKMNNNEWITSIKGVSNGPCPFGKILMNIHGKTMDSKGPSELAAEVTHTLADGKTNIVFGGLWNLDSSKNTNVKAKVSHDAKLALAVTHRLANNFAATVGAEIDATKPSNPEAVRYGLKFDVSA